MRSICMFCFLFALVFKQPRTIRIIHGGEELKPVGTILISPDALIQPSDRATDAIFGRGVKTDENTFNKIMIFISKSRYIINVKKLRDNHTNEFYTIINADGKEGYLTGKDSASFFSDLKLFLKQNDLDENVIALFSYY